MLEGAHMTPGDWFVYIVFINDNLMDSELGLEVFSLPMGGCAKND